MEKQRLFLLGLAAVGLLVLGAACGKKSTNTNATNQGTNVSNQNTNDDQDESSNENSNDGGTDDRNGNDNSNRNQNTNSNDGQAASGSLTLIQPERGEELESPFEVKGKSTAETVTVTVKNSVGHTVFSVPVTVRNGEYRVNLTFTFTNTTNGSVEVAELNGAKVSASVTFKVETEVDTNLNTNSDDTQESNNDNTNSE